MNALMFSLIDASLANCRRSTPSRVSLSFAVGHHVAGAGGAGFLGNAIVGGIIGAGVDISSGAMLDFAPNPLDVTLEKDVSAAVAER